MSVDGLPPPADRNNEPLQSALPVLPLRSFPRVPGAGRPGRRAVPRHDRQQGQPALGALAGLGKSLLRGGSGRAGSAGLQVSLSSNGIILEERLARGRVAAGVDAMVLSLAGTTAAARAFVG